MEYSNRISCIFTNKHLSVIVMRRLCSSYKLLPLAAILFSMFSGCSKITHDVYVVNQPGDSVSTTMQTVR